jgi:type I restriction enzyme, R subunit
MPRGRAKSMEQLVRPKLVSAGWYRHDWQVDMECPMTAGCIQCNGKLSRREKLLDADYLLRYSPSGAIAVVEAKDKNLHHLEGEKQSKAYAQKLGLFFAYATNGHQIAGLSHKDEKTAALTQNFYDESQIGQRGKPRYYQEMALREAVSA